MCYSSCSFLTDLTLLPVCRARRRCGKLGRFREKAKDAIAIGRDIIVGSAENCFDTVYLQVYWIGRPFSGYMGRLFIAVRS